MMSIQKFLSFNNLKRNDSSLGTLSLIRNTKEWRIDTNSIRITAFELNSFANLLQRKQ